MKLNLLAIIAITSMALVSCGSNTKNGEGSDSTLMQDSSIDTTGGTPTMTDSISTDNGSTTSGSGSATGNPSGSGMDSTSSGSSSTPR